MENQTVNKKPDEHHQPRPWLAMLLTLITPGLGFYYAGVSFFAALKIAIALDFIQLGLLSLPIRFFNWQTAILVRIVFSFILAIILLIIVRKVAQQTCQENRLTKTRFYFRMIAANLSIILLFALVEESLKLKNLHSFKMTTLSMEPTIKKGDRFLVNLIAYSELEEPKRGDIVAFKYPRDQELIYVKRVLAVPRDKISFEDKHLIINDRKQSLARKEELRDEILKDISDNQSLKILFRETLDQRSYWVLWNKTGSTYADLANWPRSNKQFTVSDANYFVVGDNRDNSTDSRVWGTVPRHLIIGRVEGVFFSVAEEGGSFFGLRLDRFLLSLNFN